MAGQRMSQNFPLTNPLIIATSMVLYVALAGTKKREAERGVNGKVRANERVNLDQVKEKKWGCEEELL